MQQHVFTSLKLYLQFKGHKPAAFAVPLKLQYLALHKQSAHMESFAAFVQYKYCV